MRPYYARNSLDKPDRQPTKARTVRLWPDAGLILGFGKEKTYRLASTGEIKTLDFSGTKKVAINWLESQVGPIE